MRRTLFLLVALVGAATLLGAQAKPADKPAPAPSTGAQAGAQKTTAPPARKARRVLTDDDFDSTRNPKALQDAAEAVKAAGAEKEKPQAPTDEVEEELKLLREQLKTTETMVANTQKNLEKSKLQAETAPDPVMRESGQESVRLLEQLVAEYRTKILELQAKVRALEKQKKGAQPEAPEGEKKEEGEKKP